MPTSEYTSNNIHSLDWQYTSIEIQHQGMMFDISIARSDGRKWLLKSVSPTATGEQEKLRTLLQREYAILQQLDSPFIVRAREIVNIDLRGLCLVEEYVEGETLDLWLQHEPNHTIRQRVLNELLEALEYLHTKQIIHGDLKPQNILITINGQHVKLIDFGLSDTDGSINKNLGCTKTYAAPEQTAGKLIDCRADIYSVGYVLKMLFPYRYMEIHRRCLAKDIHDRYPSISSIRQAIMRRKIAWKCVVGLFAIILIWWCAMVSMDYHSMQKQLREQQQTEAVIQTLHWSYDSVCTVYRDSLNAFPQDSAWLRLRAMQQIDLLHKKAMQRDSIHAMAIDQDYMNTFNLIYDQLYFSRP